VRLEKRTEDSLSLGMKTFRNVVVQAQEMAVAVTLTVVVEVFVLCCAGGAVVGSSGTEQLAGAVEVGGTSKEEERSGQQEILQDGVGGARWAEAAASQLRVRFCEKQRRLNPPGGGLDELVCSWRVGVGVGGDDLHIFSLSGEHTLTFTRGWW
jgi:hypothetical protein